MYKDNKGVLILRKPVLEMKKSDMPVSMSTSPPFRFLSLFFHPACQFTKVTKRSLDMLTVCMLGLTESRLSEEPVGLRKQVYHRLIYEQH